MEELRALFERKLPIASTVYVYTWVPVLKNAPWFPFAIIASDNKFNNAWVFEKWRLMHVVCGDDAGPHDRGKLPHARDVSRHGHVLPPLHPAVPRRHPR